MQDFWNQGDDWQGGSSEIMTPQDLFSVEVKLSILFHLFPLTNIIQPLSDLHHRCNLLAFIAMQMGLPVFQRNFVILHFAMAERLLEIRNVTCDVKLS